MLSFAMMTRKQRLEFLSSLDGYPGCCIWLWGLPEGWSDEPRALRRFIARTDGLELYERTMVLRIQELEEETAEAFLDFLNRPLNGFITCWAPRYAEEDEEGVFHFRMRTYGQTG